MSSIMTIGFLGAGKMATALARGFVKAGLITPERIIASDTIEAARSAFANEVGARTTSENLQDRKSVV